MKHRLPGFRVLVVLGLVTLSLLLLRMSHTLQLTYESSSTCEQLKQPEISFPPSQEVRDALACRLSERANRLQMFCDNTSRSYRSSVRDHLSLVVHSKKRVAMCLITKVASQFWHRLFQKFNRELKSRKNISISTDFVFKSRPSYSPVERKLFKKFVFVRNPYTRLVSAYVDKLFAVNPQYWSTAGRAILQYIRHKDLSLERKLVCGPNITFREFVDYVLQFQNKSLDYHFQPIHQKCGFCDVQYDYIGKLETLNQDMAYFSSQFGLLTSNTTRDSILQTRIRGVQLMMFSNAKNLFGARRVLMEQCGVSLLQGLRCTWRRWKIRGFIDAEIPFPKEANENISLEAFAHLAERAHDLSDPKALAKGKAMALREAFSTLNQEVKLKVKNMFLPEFKMFDYDPMPDFVFAEYSHGDSASFFQHKFS